MNPLKIGFLAAFAIAFAVAKPAVADDAATKKIIVDPLLKTGNDINGQDEKGRTPLFLACYIGELELAQAIVKSGGRVA